MEGMTDEYQQLQERCARQYLRHCAGAAKRADAAYRRIAERRKATEPKAIVYTGMPGSPNSYGDAVPDAVAEIDALTAEYVSIAERADADTLECVRALDAMETFVHAELLRLRYLDCETWAAVARKVERSTTWCFDHDGIALRELYDLMPHQWRIPRQPAL